MVRYLADHGARTAARVHEIFGDRLEPVDRRPLGENLVEMDVAKPEAEAEPGKVRDHRPPWQRRLTLAAAAGAAEPAGTASGHVAALCIVVADPEIGRAGRGEQGRHRAERLRQRLVLGDLTPNLP